MSINFFYTAALVDHNFYWSSAIGGNFEVFNIDTKKLEHIFPREGFITDDLDASAVLASDNKCIYGVINCGKYLFSYNAVENSIKTIYLGLEAERLDLVCGSGIIDRQLYFILKRKNNIYQINVDNGEYKKIKVFDDDTEEFDNIAATIGDGEYYIVENNLRKLAVVSIKEEFFLKTYNFHKDIDVIQDLSIKDESIVYIDYQGRLCEWNYYANKHEIMCLLEEDIKGKKDEWHVEMVVTQTSIWLLSSTRTIAAQLDKNSYSVVKKIENGNFIDTYMKRYYYSRNINKLFSNNMCYFAVINTNKLFVVDMISGEGGFIYDIEDNQRETIEYYCKLSKTSFYEGEMALDDYINYIEIKSDYQNNLQR